MVLLTGGAGYIGSHTLVELYKAGQEVLVVDDFSNSSTKTLDKLSQITGKEVNCIECDICDTEKLLELLSPYQIDAVIHFAANKAVGESVNNPLKYYHNNIGGLVSILQICHQKQINTLVFSSSCTVYGVPKSSPVTEDFPIQKAASPYGNTKQIGEEILADYNIAHPDFNYLNLRYFNPIGAHESGLIGDNPQGIPNNLIPFLTKVAYGELKELTVFGDDYETPDGTCVRDYIHVVDVAIAHVNALNYLKKHNNNHRVVNLGTGKGYSVLEVIETFEKATNQKVKYKIGPNREGDVPYIFADAQLAKDLLNWETQYNLEDMLASAWNFQEKLNHS